MVNQLESLDLVFQSLADPSRRVIVDRLTRGPASVSELARPLAMSMPAVMAHLRVLHDAGVITSTKVGRVRTCRVQPAVLQSAERWLTDRRAGWERSLDRLGDLLSETAPPAAPPPRPDPRRTP